MRKKSVYRGILIVAGLLAAAVIILSHSFSGLESKKVADTEQSDEKPEQQNTVISAPAEAVTQASAVKIDEQSPDMLLETLSTSEVTKKYIPSTDKVFSKLFHVLFEIVIAPNAP